MPRTKVTKNAAAKRPRNQMVEEAHSTALREIQQKADSYLLDLDLLHEQNVDKISNAIRNLRMKLSPAILRLTMGDFFYKKSTGTHDMTASNFGADMTSVSNQTVGGCLTQMSGISSKSRGGDEGKSLGFVFLALHKFNHFQ